MTPEQAAAQWRAGRPQDAAAGLEEHLARQPSDWHAWFLLGACRHACKDLPAALDAFSRSIGLAPQSSEPYVAMAVVALEAGNVEAALGACEQGLKGFPTEKRLHHTAALALEQAGRHDEALVRYEGGLAIAPHAEDLLHDCGMLLARIGRIAEAESRFLSCLTAYPRSARAQTALADVFLAQGRYGDVLQLLEHAPREALILLRKGFALAALRRFSEAQKAFALARGTDAKSVEQFIRTVAPAADPDLMLSPENVFLERSHAALRECDWSQWEAMLEESRRAAAITNVALEPAVGFMILTLPLSGSERLAVARRIAARIEENVRPLPSPAAWQGTRIRLGILSPDYREHLMGYLLLPLFELLDRGRFEVHAYSLTPEDGSAAGARVKTAADTFRDLSQLSAEEAARLIRHDCIDILVDAAGHTTGGRFAIVAHRPARLHVNYLGFCSSLGSERVDYAIVDRIAAPTPTEWSEALAYVPHPYFLYDYRDRAPELALSRGEYGLPDSAFVYCAFHRAEKISPDAFAAWMDILARVPRSVLWFPSQSAAAERNLRHHASVRGIASSRLIFAPFEPRYDPRYLARQRLGDLFLDAPHHNAITTACDALGVGLPLITLPGRAISGRTAASLLHAAGLPELVTSDRDQFVATAVRLAEDRALLLAYRQRLQRNRENAPLFDTRACVRGLERAFEEMLARARRGESPASFDV